VRRLLRRLPAAALAGAVVAVGLAATLAVTPSAAAPAAVTGMSFNVCGVVCRKGEVTSTASYVANRAISLKITVGFLQELCYSQFRAIQATVQQRGYSAVFAASTNSGACDNDDDRYGKGFGTAILVKGKTSGRVVIKLPVTKGYEKRSLLGVTATIGGRSTFLAVVHNSPSAVAGLDRQLSALGGYLNGKAAKPTIVGGDFNAMPDNPGMARFYSPAAGGTGRFTEVDETRYGDPARSGAPTFDTVPRKIDYIFVSQAHFGGAASQSYATSMSDHRLYTGTFGAR
jgi:endonuclease/exonuclease/phosphatase family metal-dependent hydrolase